MSRPILESTRKLRAALQAKAKGQSSFRFDSLYDKVFRKDVLWEAWCRCRHNGGAPGVDAVQAVHGLLCQGYTEVVDADLSVDFDTRPPKRRCPACGIDAVRGPSRERSSHSTRRQAVARGTG